MRKLNLNTKRAYQFLTNTELMKHKQLYNVCRTVGKVPMANTVIETFMNVKVPLIYPKVEKEFNNIFGGGESLQSERMQRIVSELNSVNVSPLLNFSAEYSTNEKELDENTEEMFRTIDFVKENNNKGAVILRATALMNSERLASVQRGEKDKSHIHQDVNRVDKVCKYASDKGIPIVWDSETIDIETVIHETSIDMMRKYNKNGIANIYGTVQMYRKDSHPKVDRLLELASKENFIPALKFVRGAYETYEIKGGRRDQIHDTKDDTDVSYNTNIVKCLKEVKHGTTGLHVLFATHNTESNTVILETMNQLKIKSFHPQIHTATMIGMRYDVAFNMNEHVNNFMFIPYAERDVIFPYLVRRAIENSSALGNAKMEVDMMSQELNER